jgi:uncharacterized protein (TIGR02118 family)
MEFKLIYLAKRNPSIRAEDWPRTWRSHAVFASQFKSVGAKFSRVLYCSRILETAEDGTPSGPPGASLEYDGAAFCSSPSVESVRGVSDPEVKAKIDQDELRVFSTYVREFSFRCKEVLVHGGEPGHAAVIRFLARKSGTSGSNFHSHWGERHAALAKKAFESGVLTRYVHNRLIEEPPPGYPFDGIVEMWFDSAEDAKQSFSEGMLAPLVQDLPAFCDIERSVTLLTYVTHRWPKG